MTESAEKFGPTVKFGHLTDIHLPIPERVAFRTLLNKRALGYLSWRRRRSARHKIWAADALAADLVGADCVAALISGDLVNIALAAEFQHAFTWLDEKLGRVPVVFTPGNHDTYVKTDWSETLGLLSPHMVGRRENDGPDRPPRDFNDFPFVRPLPGLEDVAIIAANSAPSTAPGLASGALGSAQIERLRIMLTNASGAFRILMLHHPVNTNVVSRRKALDDANALRAMLADTGVELVLHGHAHVQHIGAVTTPDGEAPVIGGGSASHPKSHGRFRPARYNLFTLTRNHAGEWALEMKVRELSPEARTVSTVETHKFAYAAAKNTGRGDGVAIGAA